MARDVPGQANAAMISAIPSTDTVRTWLASVIRINRAGIVSMTSVAARTTDPMTPG